MQPIIARKALFIKLGEKGKWEKECIETGKLQIGYREIPHEICLKRDWLAAKQCFEGSDLGSITRHVNQVQQFYEEPEQTLWITFRSDRMYWAFAKVGVHMEDHSKVRYTLGQWRDTDINGTPLIKSHLSGKLLAVQGFQGTICSVRELNYLLHKINGTSEPHVAAAETALENLTSALIPIIKNLHPKDLETLTDLIFRQAGWQRTGVAGETEKDIDLDLQSPITRERIAIQVKSKASLAVYRAYQEKFVDMIGFSKFYFVTHSADENLESFSSSETSNIFVFWGVNELAQQAARNGLAGWLIDKAS